MRTDGEEEVFQDARAWPWKQTWAVFSALAAQWSAV